jgi:hypothetical protein
MKTLTYPREVRINGRRFERLTIRLAYFVACESFRRLTDVEKSELNVLLKLAEAGQRDGAAIKSQFHCELPYGNAANMSICI